MVRTMASVSTLVSVTVRVGGPAHTLDCLPSWGTGCNGSGLGRGVDIGTGSGFILVFSLWSSARLNIAANVRSASSEVGTTVKGDARVGWRRASVSCMAASVAMPVDEMVGIVIWYGQNWTVRAILSVRVFVI